MTHTTIRIARPIRTSQGALIRTEVLGEWFVRPEEWPNSGKMPYIRQQLVNAQAEEPGLDWHLETRGTDVSWHRQEAAR